MRLGVPSSARLPLIGAGVFLLVSAALFAAILMSTGGDFSFTLDDPYIHLAMAEEIGRGGYGVNPGEPASASSSAVYPFLLAGLLKLGLGQGGALLVNLAAGAVSTALLLELAQEGGLVTARTPLLALVALASLLVMALNLGGLAFTGMEHGAHVAVTLAALLGVARLGRECREPPWPAPVLVAAPLVRFEGMAILVAGVLGLVVARRVRPALVATSLATLALGLFALRLQALGLPALPSSVLAKAGDAAQGIGAQFLENQRARASVLVWLALALPLAEHGLRRGPRPLRLPAVFAAAALLAQMAVGSFGLRYNGWLHRYEAWAVALAAGVVLLTYGGRVRAWMGEAAWWRAPFAGVLTLLLMQPYVQTTLDAPTDARSIRLQQREMHRFAADVLRAPVAVNDLGWVSYRNDSAVLDLWGLASEPARRARQAHLPPQWMDDLARAHGVRAAMVYDHWVGPVPRGWVRLGELRARVPMSVNASVAFYAIRPADAANVRTAIVAWARGLPGQDVFVFAAPARDAEFTPPRPA